MHDQITDPSCAHATRTLLLPILPTWLKHQEGRGSRVFIQLPAAVPALQSFGHYTDSADLAGAIPLMSRREGQRGTVHMGASGTSQPETTQDLLRAAADALAQEAGTICWMSTPDSVPSVGLATMFTTVEAERNVDVKARVQLETRILGQPGMPAKSRQHEHPKCSMKKSVFCTWQPACIVHHHGMSTSYGEGLIEQFSV